MGNQKEIKIAVLSSFTAKNLDAPLTKIMNSNDFSPIIKHGGYNQFIQELMSPDSWLRDFKPEIILIAINTKTYLDNPEYNLIHEDDEKKREVIEEKFSSLKNAIYSYNLPTKFVITTLENDNYSPLGFSDITQEWGMHGMIEKFNNLLIKMKRELSNVEIINSNNLYSTHGKINMIDNKMFYLGRIVLTNLGAEKFSEELSHIINASYGKTKKVLVCDLDNTLWGGVIGEDGPHGIKIGEGPIGEIYHEIQRTIDNYKKNGVVLAIASKNNENDVKEAFEKNNNMCLKYDDFIIKKVNWKPKSQNIKEMAEILNLGLDSFVFLDDNPVERLEVKTNIPEIEVIDFPKDISYLPSILKSMPHFKTLKVTDEDKKKTEMYRDDVKRSDFKEGETNLKDYLSKLGTIITVKKNDRESIERITQLINKTNQFNLRTQRYTKEQVLEFMNQENGGVFSVRVWDKFGELGLTGIMIIREEENHHFIDSLLLSCRILSRGIERRFIAESLRMMKLDKPIIAEFIPTSKNKALSENFYESIGFEKVKEEEGIKTYKKEIKTLDDIDKECQEYIKLENG